MLILMEEGARTMISFFIRASIPEYIVDPPDCISVRRAQAAKYQLRRHTITMLLNKSRWIWASHLMIELNSARWIPSPAIPSMLG